MPDDSTNLATIAALYAAFGQGDIPTIIDKLAEDVAWETWADNSAATAGVSYLQPRTGKDGALQFFMLTSQMKVTEFNVLSLMAGNNQVAAEFVISAQNPRTGKTYRDEEMHLWTFNEEGKVSRLRHYVDTWKHIAAAQ